MRTKICAGIKRLARDSFAEKVRGSETLICCFCPQLIVSSARDSIYEVLKTAYSDGFPEWDKSTTARYTTYEQLNAVVTGSPGSITYGPHTGELPKAAKFAALKWTDAPEPVLPSHNTVLECTKASDAFDAVTRQYTPRPTRKGCYPLAVTANVIFHHSFSDLEVCWIAIHADVVRFCFYCPGLRQLL
jgi:hypothetical protein